METTPTNSNPLTVNLNEIIIGDRLRKDYGDLTDLDTIPEVGLIQPIVLNTDSVGAFHLVAGGRRVAKLKELGVEFVYHGVTCDPEKAGFVFANELPEDMRREIELYENLNRKQITWQERVLSIADIHRIKRNRAALNAETWGTRETGAEIGQHFGTVAWMLQIAEELKNPNSPVWQCKHTTEAIRWLTEQREDAAKRQLAELTSKTVPQPSAEQSSVGIHQQPTDPETLVVSLSQMLFRGKMEDLAQKFANTADHIVTDWPYGIDMATLSQSNGMDVSRVEAEHDVKRNINDFPKWLDAMYLMLKDKGFCVIFYDNVHWNLMATYAKASGFKVCNWPLVWIKTSPCLNQMAQYNFTKATEFAMVLRKGNATLNKPQATNYWSGPRANSQSNPFAKPKRLWQWILQSFTLQGDCILDPFAGEGSSTLAAIDLGLRPLAFESNETHFNQLTTNVREVYEQLTKGKVQFI